MFQCYQIFKGLDWNQEEFVVYSCWYIYQLCFIIYFIYSCLMWFLADGYLHWLHLISWLLIVGSTHLFTCRKQSHEWVYPAPIIAWKHSTCFSKVTRSWVEENSKKYVSPTQKWQKLTKLLKLLGIAWHIFFKFYQSNSFYIVRFS